MKNRTVLALGLFLLIAAQHSNADNGTWTQTASGQLWNTTGNWAGGVVADGAAFTADFSTLDFTSDIAVHLDSAHTIGSLVFGNTDPAPAGWILDNNGNSANNLTLAGVVDAGSGNTLGLVINSGAGTTTLNTAVNLSNAQGWVNNSSNQLTVDTVNAGANHLSIESGSGSGMISVTNFNAGAGGLTINPSSALSIGTATLSGDQTWTNYNTDGLNNPNNPSSPLPALTVGTLNAGTKTLTIGGYGPPSADGMISVTNFNGSAGWLTIASSGALSIGTATLSADQTWINGNTMGLYDPNNPYIPLPALTVDTLNAGANRLTIGDRGGSNAYGTISVTNFNAGTGGLTIVDGTISVTNFNVGAGGLAITGAGGGTIDTATLSADQTWVNDNQTGVYDPNNPNSPLPALTVGTLNAGANHLTIGNNGPVGGTISVTTFNVGAGGLTINSSGALSIGTATLSADQTWVNDNQTGVYDPNNPNSPLPALTVGTLNAGANHLTIGNGGPVGGTISVTNFNVGAGGLTIANSGVLSIGTATLSADQTWINGNQMGAFDPNNPNSALPALTVGTLNAGANHLTIGDGGPAGGTISVTNFNVGGGGLTIANSGVLSIGTATLSADQTWTNYNQIGALDPNNPNSPLPALTVGTVNNGGHTLTVDGVGNTAVTGGFGGTGNLIKKGSGTFTISGASLTYSGDTFVLEGTLSLSNPILAATSTVQISSGAVLDLEFTGTDTVAALWLDGVQMPSGTYDAANTPSEFSGPGELVVIGVPEPASLLLFGLGTVLCGFRRRSGRRL